MMTAEDMNLRDIQRMERAVQALKAIGTPDELMIPLMMIVTSNFAVDAIRLGKSEAEYTMQFISAFSPIISCAYRVTKGMAER